MEKDIVTQTAGERQGLSELIAAGGAAAQESAHSLILLKAAEGHRAWSGQSLAGRFRPPCHQ